MNKTMLLAAFGIVIFGFGCRPSPKPFRPDDAHIQLYLQKPFIRDKAEWRNPTKGMYLDAEINNLGEAVVVGFINVMIDGVQLVVCRKGTHVYAHPIGYPEYKRKIYWGRNRFYIPAQLKETPFEMQILISGDYDGEAIISVTPGQKRVRLKKRKKEPAPTEAPSLQDPQETEEKEEDTIE